MIPEEDDAILKSVKELGNEEELLFKTCLDFCGNINEMMTLEEDNEMNYYNEEIIYNFKAWVCSNNFNQQH